MRRERRCGDNVGFVSGVRGRAVGKHRPCHGSESTTAPLSAPPVKVCSGQEPSAANLILVLPFSDGPVACKQMIQSTSGLAYSRYHPACLLPHTGDLYHQGSMATEVLPITGDWPGLRAVTCRETSKEGLSTAHIG